MIPDDILDGAQNASYPIEEPRSRPLLAQILMYAGLCMSTGCAAVLIMRTIEDGFDLVPSLIVSGVILAGITMMFIGARIGNFDAPSLKNNTGRSQLILMLSGVLGAAISFYLILSGTMDRFFEGDFTISRIEAIIALAIVIFALLPMAVLRERSADDFEKAAAQEASYWAFSAYLYGYIAWTIAAAGSLLPPVQDGYLFMFLVFLFIGIWAFKRSG